MSEYLVYVLKSNLLAAVCIFLVLAVSRAAKKKFSVQWRYILWLLTAVFLLLPMNLFQGRQMAAGLRDSTDSLRERILYMSRFRALKNGFMLAVLPAAALLLANLLIGCSVGKESVSGSGGSSLQAGQEEVPGTAAREDGETDRQTPEQSQTPPGEDGGLTGAEIEKLLPLSYLGDQMMTSAEEIPLPEGCVSAYREDLDSDGAPEILAAVTEQGTDAQILSLRVYEYGDGAWTESARRDFENPAESQFHRSLLLSEGQIVMNSRKISGFTASDPASIAPGLSPAGAWGSFPSYDGEQNHYRYRDGALQELTPGAAETERASWCPEAVPFCSVLYSYMDTDMSPEEEADPYNWKRKYPAGLRSFLFRTVDGAALRTVETDDFRFSVPGYFADYVTFRKSSDDSGDDISAVSMDTGNGIFSVGMHGTNPEYELPPAGGWPGASGGMRLLWRGPSGDISYSVGGDGLAAILETTAEAEPENPLETLHVLYTVFDDAELVLYTFEYTGAESGIQYPQFE